MSTTAVSRSRKILLRRLSLILVVGVAGSGKSTLAKEIVRRVFAVYLDNNQVVDPFFPDTRESSEYRKLRSSFYKVLYGIAEANLKLGNSVILDVPHVKELQSAAWRKFIKAMARRHDAALIVIHCHCSERTLHSRIKKRNELRDKWKLTHWKNFLAEQPVNVAIAFPHIEIDTSNRSSINITSAVRYIRSQST